MLGRLRITIA